MSTFNYPLTTTASVAGGATEAKQDAQIVLETAILSDTTAILSDTSSIDTKITKADTDDVTISASALPTGAATETTSAALNAKVTAVDTDDVTISASALPTGASTAALQTSSEALLTTIDADTSSIDGKITACDTDAVVISSPLPAGTNNIGDVDIASSALPSGAATAANQSTEIASLSSIESDIGNLNDRLAGNLVPETFDYLALTYVAAGDGIGEIYTVTYKTGGSAGTTVATLTLGYDSSDRLNSVTRS